MRSMPEAIIKYHRVILFILYTLTSSQTFARNKYESASSEEIAKFLQVNLPFAKGTNFTVSQGAFGKNSHNEKGNEYAWDLRVPVGTEVLSIADGKVIEIYKPSNLGGCNSKFSKDANNLKIEHKDGSLAQYVHVKSLVKLGESVKRGDSIAQTNLTGWICIPHLHFSVYKSRRHLYNSPKRESLPLRFIGVPGQLLIEGREYSN